MMEKELDNDIISLLKSKLSSDSLILDVGFGTGRISYELFHEIMPAKIIGIESRQKSEIENDIKSFPGFLSYSGESRHGLFNYYTYCCKGVYENLLDEFNFTKRINLVFRKDFNEYIRDCDNKFDLVVLFKVLHYREIGNPIKVIKNLKNILTETGLILIAFKNYVHELKNTDRQSVDVNEIMKFLDSEFETLTIRDSEKESSKLYLGNRMLKAGTNRMQSGPHQL